MVRLSLAAILSLLLTACGGGGSGGSDDNSGSANLLDSLYDIELTFPRLNSNFGGSSQTTFRGKVTSTGNLDMSDVISVTVNGVWVTFDLANLEQWSVPVNLTTGQNNIDVVVNYRDGSSETLTWSFDNEIPVTAPSSIVYDHANNRAFSAESLSSSGHIFVIDLTDGSREWVSNDVTGTGPSLGNVADIEYDATNNRLLVIHRPHNSSVYELYEVDLATGDRSEIVRSSGGPTLWNPGGMAHDPGSNRVLVVDSTEDALVAISLADGSRSVVSDADDGGIEVGTGVAFAQPRDMVLDTDNSRVIVLDGSAGFDSRDAIIEVSLVNGNRNIISDNEIGTGGSFDAISITLNTTNGVIIAGGTNEFTLIDPENGNRTVLSNDVTGTGPMYDSPRRINFDANTNQIYVANDSSSDSRTLSTYMTIDATSGNRVQISENTVNTGTGGYMNQLQDMAWDINGNRLLVCMAGNFVKGVMAINMDNGNRSIVSDNSIGSGNRWGRAYTITLIPGTTNAYVTDLRFERTLYEVDLTTGDRTIVSADGAREPTGTGDSIGLAGVAIDSANSRLINMSGDDALRAIDPENGNRTDISRNGGAGSGDDFGSPSKMVFDETNSRVFVADTFADTIHVVDTNNGVRNLLVNPGLSNPGGLDLGNTQGMVLDMPNNRLLVINIDRAAVIEVDLASGFRNILSDSTTGSGPVFSVPLDIAVNFDDNLAYVTDNNIDAVYIVDLDNGNRAIMSR